MLGVRQLLPLSHFTQQVIQVILEIATRLYSPGDDRISIPEYTVFLVLKRELSIHTIS